MLGSLCRRDAKPGRKDPMAWRTSRSALTGRAWYSVTCIAAALAVLASGVSFYVVRDVGSIGSSHAISSGPSTGAQNILLMGLESRRDWNGNILPASILAALHAGSTQGVANGVGGHATNTLILIHIRGGGVTDSGRACEHPGGTARGKHAGRSKRSRRECHEHADPDPHTGWRQEG